MDNEVYDTAFNANEWLVIGMVLLGTITMVLLPKRFTRAQVLFNLLFGVFLALMFDHTIAVKPFDLYDVGDQAQYQYYDMFSYSMYAPFGYLFIYGYEYWRVERLWSIPYILLWTLIGIGIEWVSVKVGLFHYKNGYGILYSIPIYLLTQSLHLQLYYKLFPSETPARK